MKIPLSPPDFALAVSALKPEELNAVLRIATPLPAGKYHHWDELRHRPPPEGLSHEAWWASVIFARNAQMQSLPLLDKRGESF